MAMSPDKQRKIYAKRQVNKWNTEKRKGYIYMISSPTFKDWVKIGQTQNVDKRLAGFNSHNPLRDFIVDCFIEDDHVGKAESYLLYLIYKECGEACHGEWTKIRDKDKAVQIMKNYEDKKITIEEFKKILEHKKYCYAQAQGYVSSSWNKLSEMYQGDNWSETH